MRIQNLCRAKFSGLWIKGTNTDLVSLELFALPLPILPGGGRRVGAEEGPVRCVWSFHRLQEERKLLVLLPFAFLKKRWKIWRGAFFENNEQAIYLKDCLKTTFFSKRASFLLTFVLL